MLALCVGPAGIIQLPSRDGLDDDAGDSVVESRESVRREGKSTLVGEDRSDSGSSVRVFEVESRESLERAVGCRSSKASCSSNRAIGVGETTDGSSGCIGIEGYINDAGMEGGDKCQEKHATGDEPDDGADERINIPTQRTQGGTKRTSLQENEREFVT